MCFLTLFSFSNSDVSGQTPLRLSKILEVYVIKSLGVIHILVVSAEYIVSVAVNWKIKWQVSGVYLNKVTRNFLPLAIKRRRDFLQGAISL